MANEEIAVWGSGTPRREFLHVDDLAAAALFCLRQVDGGEGTLLNVGVGTDISIRDLVEMVCDVVGFDGEVRYDAGKPDGAPRKLVDTSRLTALGWQAGIPFRTGLADTYAWYLENGNALQSAALS